MKPHKGTLNLWRKVTYSNGYNYEGIFEGHPEFNGSMGYTSLILKEEGKEIETLNSRYTLGEPLPENMEWI